MRSRRVEQCWLWGALTFTVAACSSLPYSPRPLNPEATAPEYAQRSGNADGLKRFAVANGYPESAWPPAEWGLRELTLASLYFHPDMGSARARAQVAHAELSSVAAAAGADCADKARVSQPHASRGQWTVEPWARAGNSAGGTRQARRARRARCCSRRGRGCRHRGRGLAGAREGTRPVTRSAGPPGHSRTGRGTTRGTQGDACAGGAPSGSGIAVGTGPRCGTSSRCTTRGRSGMRGRRTSSARSADWPRRWVCRWTWCAT